LLNLNQHSSDYFSPNLRIFKNKAENIVRSALKSLDYPEDWSLGANANFISAVSPVPLPLMPILLS